MENEKQIEALNDLVQINNDRIEGYYKAIEELQDESDVDLKTLFQRMATDSQNYNMELAKYIGALGGEIAEGSSGAGKVYRVWMDVKALFSGGDRKAVLDNCENGEDAAQRAYDSVLNETDLAPDIRSIIMDQKKLLIEAHDQIKALRDAL